MCSGSTHSHESPPWARLWAAASTVTVSFNPEATWVPPLRRPGVISQCIGLNKLLTLSPPPLEQTAPKSRPNRNSGCRPKVGSHLLSPSFPPASPAPSPADATLKYVSTAPMASHGLRHHALGQNASDFWPGQSQGPPHRPPHSFPSGASAGPLSILHPPELRSHKLDLVTSLPSTQQ